MARAVPRPTHINVTSGGKITGGTAGIGATSLFDFVTDDLTLSGAAALDGLGSNNNSLVTEISKLTATDERRRSPIRLFNLGALRAG